MGRLCSLGLVDRPADWILISSAAVFVGSNWMPCDFRSCLRGIDLDAPSERRLISWSCTDSTGFPSRRRLILGMIASGRQARRRLFGLAGRFAPPSVMTKSCSSSTCAPITRSCNDWTLQSTSDQCDSLIYAAICATPDRRSAGTAGNWGYAAAGWTMRPPSLRAITAPRRCPSDSLTAWTSINTGCGMGGLAPPCANRAAGGAVLAGPSA